jgi:integrase
MAVAPRKTKGGIVYWVATSVPGRKQPYWRRSGGDKRAAERLDAELKKQVKAGTFQAEHRTGKLTIRTFAESWAKARTNRTAADERRWLRLHVLTRDWFAATRLADTRPKHFLQLIREIRAGGGVAEKSLSNIYGVLRTMFRDALLDELVLTNPCILPRGEIKRGQRTREKHPYSKADAWALTHDPAIPEGIRVLNAMMIFGAMREGEACGRRWRTWVRDAKPLTCLVVDTQYNDRPLKTDRDEVRPRKVPVHPELDRLLRAWWERGFELLTGRKPALDDFIVPNAGPRSKRGHHTRSSAYKAFRRACDVSAVENLSLHSTRHTAITWTRRGGARADVYERVSHNAKGSIIDQYTHFDWDGLCEAVLCLHLDPHQEPHDGGQIPPDSDGSGDQVDSRNAAISQDMARSGPGSIPGASTAEPAQKTRPQKSDLGPRQRALETLREIAPDEAAPGLALCRGLRAALDGDEDALHEALAPVAREIAGGAQ